MGIAQLFQLHYNYLLNIDYLYLLSKILNNNIKIIFTTAYSEFAVESYNLNAIDYLLKPFEFERFYKASKKTHDNPVKLNEANEKYVFVKGSIDEMLFTTIPFLEKKLI